MSSRRGKVSGEKGREGGRNGPGKKNAKKKAP